MRRLLMVFCVVTLVGSVLAASKPPAASFSVVEAGIPEMQAALEANRVTSRQLVQQYLVRIATYEDKLHAAITINPKALEEADARDRERKEKHLRGPLHGIPIAIKDNIQTTDLPTTGGALAFDGFVPPYEATLVKNLREAGAIILAKTQMTELANFVASGMPGNYNAVSGYGMNPYDPRRDPREATADGRPILTVAGSSSGIGTTANLWAASVGTETSGSILTPSSYTMLVGIKPTVGRISRYGVIPITADQDTAGPMAKTVTDAAILLGVLEGKSPDPQDPVDTACGRPGDYRRFLNRAGLKGARIGIPRAFFYNKVAIPGEKEPDGGLNPDQAKLMDEAIAVLKREGAVIIDPADLPSILAPEAGDNLLKWGPCGGYDEAKGKDADCSVVLKYGMKRDFNKWLASLGAAAPVKTLTELRLWNVAHQRGGAIKYGQAQLDISDEMNVETDRPRYEADLAKNLRLTAKEGIDSVMDREKLDALLFPSSSGCWVSAMPGYPTVIVPLGFVPNAPTPPFPAGVEAKPSPYGVSFAGKACSEPRLIELAYAFEQATKRRVPPPFAP
ncbi:MAG TPA: amidase family protein [Candidatus Polarisedimenticolia bacterium]|nr:amidase family protein [Candidatus Polarisedimenticolia bacterium]